MVRLGAFAAIIHTREIVLCRRTVARSSQAVQFQRELWVSLDTLAVLIGQSQIVLRWRIAFCRKNFPNRGGLGKSRFLKIP